MNKETLDIMNSLAIKFGTTAEYLWGVLLKQAKISAATDAIIAATIIILMVIVAAVIVNKSKPPLKTESNRYPRAALEDESLVGAWVCYSLIGSIAAIIACMCIQQSITGFANPEYWALKQIIK